MASKEVNLHRHGDFNGSSGGKPIREDEGESFTSFTNDT